MIQRDNTNDALAFRKQGIEGSRERGIKNSLRAPLPRVPLLQAVLTCNATAGWGSRVAALLLATVALSGLCSCSRPPNAQSTAQNPNVLLIVVDTLRADRLGCYGSPLGATPRMDALAADGVRFAQAYAHAPWTLPSFASLFTSQAPPQHGAGGQLGHFKKLPLSARTIAEVFRKADYNTAAIVNVEFLTQPFGMAQGFVHVDSEVHLENTESRSATATTDAALKWLHDRPNGPFFLFVHYFDPHLTYNPPAEYRRRFAEPQDQVDSGCVFGLRDEVIAYHSGQKDFDAATIRRAEKLYNGEVAYTDQEIGRLLDGLAELKLGERTMVVLTADHGEEFLDHGRFEHGHSLYDELLHVPLIVRAPGHARGAAISAPVGLIDVAPTLCALAGIAAPPSFTGRSLQPALDGAALEPRPVAMEGNFWGPSLSGWVADGYKLVVGQTETRLFNLAADPQEQTDLSQRDPQRTQQMLAEMTAALAAMQSAAGRSEPVTLPPEELERLRSLGYAP